MRRTNGIGLSDIGHICVAVEHYYTLINWIRQLDHKQIETLDKFYKDKIESRGTGPQEMWYHIDLHYIEQSWSNTSCGWQSIGGAAISSAYTTLILNPYYGAAFIYYKDILAYIAYMDEKLEKFKLTNYRTLPGISDAKRELNLIYSRRY